VSHELRSPLTTVATAAEVLQSRRDELPERSRLALDLLVAELKRFEHLVQDLLEISRFDAGAAELTSDDVRVGEFVRQAVGAAGAAPIPVEVADGLDEVVVPVDKRRLERVLTNLLDNARLHAGGAEAVRVQRANGSIRVLVEDRGAGVPEGDKERIFERFVRGASAGGSDAGEGVGLGLALVAEHVRLHDGSIWVEDRDEGGSRFVIEIPMQASRRGPRARRGPKAR
jgi:signal transduction histidine kinase